jgi:hypothetical protein
MKENCIAFDAFGQWFEHEVNKMRWMEKVGGGWRPRLARPATYSLFPTFFSTNILFSLTTTTLVHNGATLATWASCSATYHGRPATPWCPYQRPCQGEPPPSSHKLTSKSKVSESFSKFQVCQV